MYGYRENQQNRSTYELQLMNTRRLSGPMSPITILYSIKIGSIDAVCVYSLYE